MKSRIRSLLAVLALVSFVFVPSAHAGVLDKKSMQDVKKVALVSFYSPKRVQSAVHPMGKGWIYEDPNLDGSHGAALAGKVQADSDVQSLYDAALVTFQARLAEVNGWAFVPFSDVSANAAYKAVDQKALANTPAPEGNTAHMQNSGVGLLKKLGKLQPHEERRVNRDDAFNTVREAKKIPALEDNRVAAGMLFIPIESLTDGEIRFGNDPFKGQKEILAKLAHDLNVDAVAVVNVTFAYRYDKPATRKTRNDQKALTRIGARLLLVNKDGKVAGDNGAIQSDGREDFEGPEVSLVENSRMRLEDPDVRKSYESAMAGSAGRMKDVLSDAFEKIK